MRKKILFKLPVFILIICNSILSCEKPVSFSETDTVKFFAPEYDRENLPLLLSYKIVITNKSETKTFYETPDSNIFTINLPKEHLSSILIYPVTKQNFFLPAGCIYPVDFYSVNKPQICVPKWSSANACILLSELLSSKNPEHIKAAELFNWAKFEETLSKKDSDSFNKFDSLKTKKCTLSCNLKKEALKNKILHPDSKITVSYYETKSLLPEEIKDEKIEPSSKIYCEYIPLNSFYKEKGWITFQIKSDSKTAFLLDNKVVYISK